MRSTKNPPIKLRSFLWQGIAAWIYGGLIIALIYTLALGYYSQFASLKDYVVLFLYGILLGIAAGVIFGSLCAAIIALYSKISGKAMEIFRIGPLCFSIFVSIVLIIFFYRKFAVVISYLDYPFIQSYRGMLTFIVLRMIALSFASVMLIFPLYGILLRLKNFIHRFRRGVLLAGVLFVIILLAGLLLCGSYFSSKAKVLVEVKPFHARYFSINSERQVYIFGADGSNWGIINTLIAQGLLPNIKELMERGSYAPLKTLPQGLSPIIWTSIDSGKLPYKHGIWDWYSISIPGLSNSLVPNRVMGVVPLSSIFQRTGVPVKLINNYYGNRRAKPIWEILSEQKAKVGVINWIFTWPAQKVNGFILSDKFPYYLLQEPGGRDRLNKNLMIETDNPQLAVAYPTDEVYQALSSYLETYQLKEINRNVHLMKKLSGYPDDRLMEQYLDFNSLPFIYKMIAQYQPDFMALYMSEPDKMQHFFWNYWEPQFFPPLTPEDFKKYKGIIPEVYAKVDIALGKLIECARDDAIIILISDHGFGANFNSPTPGGHHTAPDGILIIAGKNIKIGAEVKHPRVIEIVPTILYLFNLPVAQDMDGRVLTELIDDDYLNKHPITYIDSYGAPGGGDIKSREKMSEEVLKKLKALGYIQ
jgi:MFS family permease